MVSVKSGGYAEVSLGRTLAKYCFWVLANLWAGSDFQGKCQTIQPEFRIGKIKYIYNKYTIGVNVYHYHDQF